MMEYGLVALWLVVYIALLLAGLPLAAVLFPRLADRGAGVAIPLSAAILWVVAYWVGHVSLALSLWVGIGVLLALVATTVYVHDIDLEWRIVAETICVFSVAFLFLIRIRMVDPAVHPSGGEKFLDFGLLKSLLRANVLPPEDMWFAGKPVKYYYGGHLFASLLTRLTGTAPKYAYNLSLAGFYAMLVTAAYGLAGSITANRNAPRWVGGLLGAFFVGFASNLLVIGQLILWLLPDGIAGFVAGILSVEQAGLAAEPAQFSYWTASRIIDGTINEFPLFAWLNGDLHAHMMSTPFLLLTAALLYSYYRTPEHALRRRLFILFGAVPPLAGLIAVVNTWSFPTIGGLVFLTVLLSPSDPMTLLPAPSGRWLRGRWQGQWLQTEAIRGGIALGAGAVVVLIGLFWSAPFWFGTASGRSIAFFPKRSSLGELLIVHGGFLLIFIPYLLRQSLPRIENKASAGAMLFLVSVLALLSMAPAVVLFAPLVVIGWGLIRLTDRSQTSRSTPETATASADGGYNAQADTADTETGLIDRPGFETILLIAGAGLLVLVEFVYVKENAGPGRLNTVFKTYMQVWVLWAVAAGAALTHLISDHRPSLAFSGGGWRLFFSALAIVLVASTSLYGGFALHSHFTSESDISRTADPTLDSMAFIDTRHPEEAPAIRWLDSNIDGQPNIVSAGGGGYRWTVQKGKGSNAPSSLTGIPTVVGWYHESGYRGDEAYQKRLSDVSTIYTGRPKQQVALLEQYNVEYIYVGPAERNKYSTLSFEQIDGIDVAKQWDEVTIYRVNQASLATDTTSGS